MGILALVSIDHAGSEASSGARARSTAQTLHAADGGMQLAMARLMSVTPSLDSIDITIGDIDVESRTRGQTTAQSLEWVGSGASPDGYAVTVGSGRPSQVYRVNITAVSPNGSTSEVESRSYRFSGAASAY